MIKHIVGFNFKKEFTAEENLKHAKKVKEELEGLRLKIEQIKSIEVIIEPLESGSFDVLLISEFESVETLETYQIHEEHIRVKRIVGSFLTDRKCIDYEM